MVTENAALRVAEVVPYLLGRDLIAKSALVQGDFRIVDVSRRNYNLKVISSRGPSYLIKQGLGGNRATVSQEASIYRWLAVKSDSGISQYLPRFHLYDEGRSVLVLELLKDAQNLRQHQTRSGRFSVALARSIGDTLASLHSTALLAGARENGVHLRRDPPWILSLHQPGTSLLREASGANIRLVKTIQKNHELGRRLDELRASWRPNALLHCDLRWDNWLIARREGRGIGRLALIDWELVSMGDAAWDVGSAIADYLGAWIFSIPITGEEPPVRYLELTRYPLRSMRPAIRALWGAYRRRAVPSVEASEFLIRAVRYAAARLLQAGYEQLQSSPQFTGTIVCLVQLTLNILRRTEEALVQLLGLPPGSDE